MKVLLDTHVALWAREDGPTLPREFRDAILNVDNRVYVSAVSLAEIAVKRAIGKLKVPSSFVEDFTSLFFGDLPFTSAHAAQLDKLPLHHRDPFDRMLVAQALTEDAVFLTVDPHCLRYEVKVL